MHARTSETLRAHLVNGALSDDKTQKLPRVVFTYDDGLRNFYENALPLHLKHNIPATVGVIAGRLMDPKYWKRHMRPAEVSELVKAGVEIASHGYYHERKLTDLPDEQLEFEVSQGKQLLSGFLPKGRNITSICVPFSAYDERVLERCRRHYSVIRVHGRKLNRGSSTLLCYSHALGSETTLTDVISWIHRAIYSNKTLVLMLHGVTDGHRQLKRYEIHLDLLQSILELLSGRFRNEVVPCQLRDLGTAGEDGASDSGKSHTVPPPAPSSALAAPVIQARSEHSTNITRLVDHQDFRITYHQRIVPSPYLLITFGGLPSDIADAGFGTSFATSLGYDHVYVAQRRGTQYQELSTEQLCDAVHRIMGNRTVVTYGSSLGGYCALYYGGPLNAKIIASGPKNSAHPVMRKARFKSLEFKHGFLSAGEKTQRSCYLLYDPHREDEAKFIKKEVQPAYPNAIHLKFPFSGHTVLDTIRQFGELKLFVKKLIEEDVVLPMAIPEEKNWIYHAEKGRYLLRTGKRADGISHLRTSLAIRVNQEAAEQLILAFVRGGNAREAKKVLDSYMNADGSPKKIKKFVLDRMKEAEELHEPRI